MINTILFCIYNFIRTECETVGLFSLGTSVSTGWAPAWSVDEGRLTIFE